MKDCVREVQNTPVRRDFARRALLPRPSDRVAIRLGID